MGATAGVGGSGSTSGGAGAGGGGAGGRANGIAELAGALDGWLVQLRGEYNISTDSYLIRAVVDGVSFFCASGKFETHFDHPIGGVPGARYLMSLHFYGILEPRNYGPSVERESGATRPANLDTGADPPPWAFAAPGVEVAPSDYNTYEIRVFDETMTEVGAYFLNSDTANGRYTLVIDYERTIPVVGGGVVRLGIVDNNCRIMKNCGAKPGYPCASKARLVDVAAADPQPPPDFRQPGLGSDLEYSGQWLMIDVTGVEAQ